MNIKAEERVALALRARAGEVHVEDLRPLEIPDPAPASRKPLLLTLAAVAVAAVVAVPFVGGSDEVPDREDPDGVVRMDVDGDGGPDLVSVDFDPGEHTYQVRAQLFGGGTLVHQGLALNRPTLIGAVDLDGDYSDEIAVHVGDDTATLPEFIRHLDGVLVRLAPPAEDVEVNGWRQLRRGSEFTLRQGRLYSWLPRGGSEGDTQRVRFWRWQVVGTDRIEPGPQQDRCLPPGVDFPVDCLFLPETVTSEQQADLDGDGRLDTVRLDYVAAPDDDSVTSFTVAYRLASGETGEVVGPAGWRPELLPPVAVAGDARQQVVVRQEGGDSDVPTVLGWADGALRVLPAPAEPPLQGSVDLRGRVSGYGVDGDRLLAWRTVPGEAYTRPTRVDVWSFVVQGRGLGPVPEGQQCLVEGSDLPEPC
jgi:hypothetical protein